MKKSVNLKFIYKCSDNEKKAEEIINKLVEHTIQKVLAKYQ